MPNSSSSSAVRSTSSTDSRGSAAGSSATDETYEFASGSLPSGLVYVGPVRTVANV